MGNIKVAIDGLEEPSKSIGNALMEFYETMKNLELSTEKGGKQATKIVMTISDIEKIFEKENTCSCGRYLGKGLCNVCDNDD